MTELAIPAANGIPLLGLGTYPLQGDEVYRAVRMAIDLGIRHIDTAQMYGNEHDVGRAVAASGIPRSSTLRRHQGGPRQCRRGALRADREAFGRGSRRAGRPAAHPLAPRRSGVRRRAGPADGRAGQGTCQGHRRQQFLTRHDAARAGALRRRPHQQPGRVSSAARPDGGARDSARARHRALGLFAARPRCCAEAADHSGHRPPHRPQAFGSGAALDHAAGRRRDPDDDQARECAVEHLRPRASNCRPTTWRLSARSAPGRAAPSTRAGWRDAGNLDLSSPSQGAPGRS